MPYSVKDLFERLSAILKDPGAVRWPYSELLGWVNDGAIRICNAKPNANTAVMDVDLDAGTQQSIPDGTTLLVRSLLTFKSDGTSRATTPCSRQLMDGFMPGWHMPALYTATALADHVIYDPAEPDVFHVWPPNDGNGKLKAEFAVTPVPADLPSNPADIEEYAAISLPLGDEYIGPLVDYVAYRAYSKDAANPNAMGRATNHFQAFQIAIGEKIQKDMTMNVATSHALPRT